MLTWPTRQTLFVLIWAVAACGPATAPPSPPAPRVPTVTPVPLVSPTRPPAATATPRASVSEPRLTRYFVNGSNYPLAVCNDGSTPAFYLARGTGDGERKWVVLLEGDGFCADSSSCAARDRDETSSRTAPTDVDGAGIASADPAQNPDFWNWNRAVLIYCTSDLWTGTRFERDNDTDFYFRGHYVLNAFFGTLGEDRTIGTPSLRAATQVLLAGTGAGGEGLLHNLNRLPTVLAPARVTAVVDGATAPWVSPFLVQEQEERLISALKRWLPRLDDACISGNAARAMDCLRTTYLVRQGYILSPLFVRQDQLDAHALISQMINGATEGQRQLVRAFAEDVRALARQQSGAYAPASRLGVTLTNAEFNRQQAEGITFAQALGNWYFDRAGPKKVVAVLP